MNIQDTDGQLEKRIKILIGKSLFNSAEIMVWYYGVSNPPV